MSSPKHLAILKKALNANDLSHWDDWRHQSPDVNPDLSGSDLRAANLTLADLRGVNLTGAALGEASLRGAYLNRANLSRASLERANLFQAKLGSAVLIGASLRFANLNRADLAEARLSGASLTGAKLTVTNLEGANLTGADLVDADLTGANLVGANLSRAELAGADFSQTRIHLTTFADVDLSAVRGLGDAIHLGPSTVDIATLYKSSGNIPQVFLRGVGVPDPMIGRIKSFAYERGDLSTCFICHAAQDGRFAQRLCNDLRASDIRAWSAPEDPRDKFHESVDEARRRADKLLLVLSEHSIGGEWVENEIMTILEKERRESRNILILIQLDETLKGMNAAWGADVFRTPSVVDFRNWGNAEEYRKAFKRLLLDLRGEAGLVDMPAAEE